MQTMEILVHDVRYGTAPTTAKGAHNPPTYMCPRPLSMVYGPMGCPEYSSFDSSRLLL